MLISKPALSLLLGFLALPLGVAVAQATTYDLIGIANSTGLSNLFAPGTSAGSAGGPGTFTVTADSLKFTATSTGGATFFVATLGDALTLTHVGDKVTLNFSVTGANITAQSQMFRFGLLNVGEAFDGTFGNESGYSASYGNTGNPNNGVYERTENSGNLFSGMTRLAASDSTQFAFYSRVYSSTAPAWGSTTGGYVTSGGMTIELLEGNQVSITVWPGDGGRSAQTYIADNPFTEFNAIYFSMAANQNDAANLGSLIFSNITVTGPIPEPSSSALIASFLILLGVGIRRQRRLA